MCGRCSQSCNPGKEADQQVEERCKEDCLTVGEVGVGVERDAVREMLEQVFNQPDVIPGVVALKVYPILPENNPVNRNYPDGEGDAENDQKNDSICNEYAAFYVPVCFAYLIHLSIKHFPTLCDGRLKQVEACLKPATYPDQALALLYTFSQKV